jgi:hypothetical protein
MDCFSHLEVQAMKMMSRLCMGLLVLGVIGGAGGPCAAQPVQPGGSVSQVRYSYDRFGGVTGAIVQIRTDHSAWVFNAPRSFLDLPVAMQVNLLDQRLGLGGDRDLVGNVLDGMRQARQQQAQQNQMNQINQMLQQQQQLMQQQQQQQQMLQQLNQINRLNQPPVWQPPPLPPRIP